MTDGHGVLDSGSSPLCFCRICGTFVLDLPIGHICHHGRRRIRSKTNRGISANDKDSSLKVFSKNSRWRCKFGVFSKYTFRMENPLPPSTERSKVQSYCMQSIDTKGLVSMEDSLTAKEAISKSNGSLGSLCFVVRRPGMCGGSTCWKDSFSEDSPHALFNRMSVMPRAWIVTFYSCGGISSTL